MSRSHRNESSKSPYLNTAGAAEYLQIAAKTLEKFRVFGGGPRYRKHGRRVVYRREDLDAWSEERAFHSTTEADAKGAR
jgi:hypothetical protein